MHIPGDFLLALCNVVKRLTVYRLACMLLCLRGWPALNRPIGAYRAVSSIAPELIRSRYNYMKPGHITLYNIKPVGGIMISVPVIFFSALVILEMFSLLRLAAILYADLERYL